MSKERKNVYVCQVCEGSIVTVDLVEGVTPFTIRCRATEGCKGTMYSSFYKVDQTLEPQFEWYKPTSFDHYPIESRQGMKEHVAMGGLDIRVVGGPPKTVEEQVREVLRKSTGPKEIP